MPVFPFCFFSLCPRNDAHPVGAHKGQSSHCFKIFKAASGTSDYIKFWPCFVENTSNTFISEQRWNERKPTLVSTFAKIARTVASEAKFLQEPERFRSGRSVTNRNPLIADFTEDEAGRAEKKI